MVVILNNYLIRELQEELYLNFALNKQIKLLL